MPPPHEIEQRVRYMIALVENPIASKINRMELSENELKALKGKEVEILAEFQRVSSLLGLHYFAMGGTLIGAIRHQGFIPWDDDIDLGMFYEDFVILKKEWPRYAKPDFFFQDIESDPEYLLPWAKIRMNQTIFLEASSSKLHINHGIFIDIFPYFSCSNNRFKQCFVYFNYKINLGRINSSFADTNNKAFKNFLYFVASGFASPKKCSSRVWRHMAKNQKKYSKNNTRCLLAFFALFFPSSLFDGYLTVPFENQTISINKKYDQFLRLVFGDYMVLPPEEKRNPHHNLISFSTTNSENEPS